MYYPSFLVPAHLLSDNPHHMTPVKGDWVLFNNSGRCSVKLNNLGTFSLKISFFNGSFYQGELLLIQK